MRRPRSALAIGATSDKTLVAPFFVSMSSLSVFVGQNLCLQLDARDDEDDDAGTHTLSLVRAADSN